MKWLFILLLLANIGFAAWGLLRPASVTTPPAASAGEISEGGHLMLLSEAAKPLPAVAHSPAAPPLAVAAPASAESPAPASPLASVEAAVSARAPTRAPDASRCFLVSDIESEAAREKFAAALTRLGGQVTGRGTASGERIRFWVMIPPFASPGAAGPTLQRIKTLGINDYYFVRNGENQNAISLGVYSTREIAVRRMNQMHEKGLRAEMREVPYPVTRYRAEVTFRRAPPANWASAAPYGAVIEGKSCR